jgi:hypothetical protein
MKLGISTKIWGAFCLTLWCTLAYAQNLLTNGSFETITTCPTGFNATAPTTFAGTGWSAPTAGTSDMICRDAPATSFSVTITPMPTAQAGTRYAGMQYGSAGGGYAEYLTTQLSSALVAGKTYTIEFYVWANVCASGCGSTRSELPTAYKNFGVRFSTAAPSLGAGSFAFIPPTFGSGGASISSSSTAYNAKTWVKETLTYTAVGGETYATFGTFVATPLPTWTAATNAYLFIDNASVVQACNAGSTAPTLSGTTLSNTCPTTTVNLNSLHTGTIPNGARLRWHTVATNPTTLDSVATPSVLATAGTYYAYYFDAMNNCYSPATAAVTVTINSNPNAPTTTVSQPTCAVSTGVITVTIPTSGVTYSFDNGTTYQASAMSNALASGTYQVVVKNSVSNCVSTPTATTVNPQPASPTISLVAKGDPSVSSCPMLNNGTISVTATGSNLLFSKDNGATWQANNVFSTLTAGSYSIKVKDNVSNCEAVYATNPVVLTAPSCGTGCNVPKPSITNH